MSSFNEEVILCDTKVIYVINIFSIDRLNNKSLYS